MKPTPQKNQQMKINIILLLAAAGLTACNPEHLGVLSEQQKPITCDGAFGYKFGAQIPTAIAQDSGVSSLWTTNLGPIHGIQLISLGDGRIFRIDATADHSSSFFDLTDALEKKYGFGTSVREDTNSWTMTWTNSTCRIRAWMDDKGDRSGIEFTDTKLEQLWSDEIEKGHTKEAKALQDHL